MAYSLFKNGKRGWGWVLVGILFVAVLWIVFILYRAARAMPMLLFISSICTFSPLYTIALIRRQNIVIDHPTVFARTSICNISLLHL